MDRLVAGEFGVKKKSDLLPSIASTRCSATDFLCVVIYCLNKISLKIVICVLIQDVYLCEELWQDNPSQGPAN